MPKLKSPRPSNLELQVLAVLWNHGPSTVRDVLALLPDKKQRAYTTILSVLQNMEKKRLVTKTRQGAAHLFEARESQRQTLGPVLQGLIQNVFGGRVSTVVQHFLETDDISDDELKEIRRMVDKKRKSNHTEEPR